MNKKNSLYLMMLATLALPLSSCSDDTTNYGEGTETDANHVGKATGNFSAEEWFPGGELGTTDNTTAGCYEDETPAVSNSADLLTAFHKGEALFERNYTVNTAPFKGLGPAYLRTSCIDCHPGYGHGKAQPNGILKATFGNGYLMAIYHPTAPGSNDGPYISEVTGMPQQKATSPFLAPINEDAITIQWKEVTSMPSGIPMKFKDGETFALHYPEVTIPTTAFNTDPQPTNIEIRLESTIGIIGTGLIDAIPEDSIIKQYETEAAQFAKLGYNVSEYLNPNMWDATNNKMANSAWYGTFTASGAYANGSQPKNHDCIIGNKVVNVPAMLKRYTYALTRATLQDGPGANAIWNITNVSRSDRPKLYTTSAWAKAMSENPQVIAAIKADPTSPYYANGTEDGIKDAVRNLLDPSTNQFNNPWHNFTPEQDDDSYYAFMVWHRGLAIPRARNLNDKDVQRGKELFMQMGCVSCHRPSWTTGDDNYWISDNIKERQLPKYPKQKIFPYSDFIQHKLDMINDIHGSWCRTTPLWGRGLSLANTGAEERLHDCRARNEVEAIMWHCYSKNSQAYWSAKQFYDLSKSDRDAVVKFLRSI